MRRPWTPQIFPSFLKEIVVIQGVNCILRSTDILMGIEFFHKIKDSLVKLRMIDDLNELHSLLFFFGKDLFNSPPKIIEQGIGYRYNKQGERCYF